MTDILDAAEAEAIAERTLRRAKRDLSVKANRDGPNGTWRWHPPAPETRTYYQERD
jgi:hypothetical protein